MSAGRGRAFRRPIPAIKETLLNPFQALFLGVLQGLTEFLPLSSSGHMVLLPALLGWTPPPLVFETTVHLGTLLALLVVFWRDIGSLLVAWWRGIRCGRPLATSESRLAWWILLGTMPALGVGVFLEEHFEALNTPHFAGIFFLATAGLLLLAELFGRRRRPLKELTWPDSLFIGLAQAAAILPGLSRSGATISVGMLTHLKREAAARFSFLLAVPIVAGAGLLELGKLLRSGGGQTEALLLLLGFFSAALCGFAAIRFLLAYVRRRPLYPFALYCLLIGLVALLAL